MSEEWKVIVDPQDEEVFAVQGAYRVCGNLPIEDARLISAAPEQHEALEDALADRPGWREKARRALAKARGEDVT